jgi:pyrroloquinoline quinone biosynthesis protein B
MAGCTPVRLAGGARRREDGGVKAVVLGVAQDGGVPHLGCGCATCTRARTDPAQRELAAAIALCDETSGKRWIVDCTPDFPAQVDLLARLCPGSSPRDVCDGILLTHAHMGHYVGLAQLGTEVLSASRLPVWATAKMGEFLCSNDPWKALVEKEQIDLRLLTPGSPLELAPGFTVTPELVPHRDELSDTVGFRIAGPDRTLLFIPDVDKWEQMDPPLLERLEGVDVALLDGTFFSPDELPHRALSKVRHPFITESVDLLGSRVATGACEVIFIHLNHTNPALDPASDERRRLEHAGFRVAVQGMEIPLSR